MTDPSPLEHMAARGIDNALAIHREPGPGLLETVYETVLADALMQEGFAVDRQVPIDIAFRNRHFPGAFRADTLVEKRLLVEIKSVEKLVPVHGKQVLTYLRLMNQPLGLLLNFGGATLKEGIKRVAKGYKP